VTPAPAVRDRGFTLADGINRALDEILAADETALIMGEDVGAVGGVFRITRGLHDTYGADRVVDTPLAEAGLVGTAVGLALNGFRPIVEIQFDGFIFPAMNEICCHVARFPARLDHAEGLPLTIRIPVGGRISAAELHSESPETYFAHTPDLRVVAASTPDTAGALLRAVHASDDPCIYLEPKRLYRRTRIPAADEIAHVDPWRARVLRAGDDATIVTYGPCVPDALEAADVLAAEGHEVGVLDLVCLAPIDEETLLEMVSATGRLVVVTEAVERCSIASEVIARVATQAYDKLRAAPRSVAAPNHPPPASTAEDVYFPNATSVVAATREVIDA
jgi:pyruvate dehydrogenase E1 component beta subunit